MRYFGALPEGAPLFCARMWRLERKVAGNVEVCARMGRLVRKVAGRRKKAGGRRGVWSVDELWGK